MTTIDNASKTRLTLAGGQRDFVSQVLVAAFANIAATDLDAETPAYSALCPAAPVTGDGVSSDVDIADFVASLPDGGTFKLGFKPIIDGVEAEHWTAGDDLVRDLPPVEDAVDADVQK